MIYLLAGMCILVGSIGVHGTICNWSFNLCVDHVIATLIGWLYLILPLEDEIRTLVRQNLH